MFRICGCLLVLLFSQENRTFGPTRPAFFAMNNGNYARFGPKDTPYRGEINIPLKFLSSLFSILW
jgi:hypothetical protein